MRARQGARKVLVNNKGKNIGHITIGDLNVSRIYKKHYFKIGNGLNGVTP